MSGEYYEDDLYATTGRGQRALLDAVRQTDPWDHNIDTQDDVVVDLGGDGYEGSYEGSEDGDDEYGGMYDYYPSGASLASDEDFSPEEIGRRRLSRRRLRRKYRRRRSKLGSVGQEELRKKQAETKNVRAKRRALQKKLAKRRAADRKEERRTAREARRAERLARKLESEERRLAAEQAKLSRLEELEAQDARMEELEAQDARMGTPQGSDELTEDLYAGSKFTKTAQGLRYAGDVLPAKAGSAVFSIKGMLNAGKSIYDTSLGRAYFHRVLEHDDDDFFGSREEALDFASEHFGLDFAGAKEDKHTGALSLYSGDKLVANLQPFTINTDLDTSIDTIKGFGQDADTSAVVHEGGWRATLHADATLYGLYGGEEGKRASKGDAIFYYETHVQNEDSEVPVIFHFETHEPVSMKPKNGKIQSELAVQYVDLLHPDPDTFDGVADRTIRLKEAGTSACDVNISTNVHF
jgi:hypothetical protein